MLNHTEAEERTLDHTSPRTCIYIPPLIKALFPQHQCKSSFRKFTIKSIKTYTPKYNKNMIHNFSDHTLTEDEFSVLTKGSSFAPTPSRTFQHEMNISWNKFMTRMLTNTFFATSFMISPPPLLRGNPTGYPLPLTTQPYLIFSHALNKNSAPSTPHVGKSNSI